MVKVFSLKMMNSICCVVFNFPRINLFLLVLVMALTTINIFQVFKELCAIFLRVDFHSPVISPTLTGVNLTGFTFVN